MAEATPFAQVEWEEAAASLADPDPVVRAWAFFVRCRMSLSSRMNEFAPLSRVRTRRRMSEQVSAWLTCVEGLPAVHARLKRVAILCRPAMEVIRSQDAEGVLFYLDPPYVHGTRASTQEYGNHEMSDKDHSELLELLRTAKGRVMLSGYRNAMYDEALSGWTRHEFDMPNHAAGGKAKRRMVECVWCNW